MYFYQAVMALEIIVFLFRGFLQPPLTVFTDLLAAPTELHLLLHLMVFAFFGRALEEAMGTQWFAATFVSGALAGNLVGGVSLFGYGATFAGGVGSGIMALIGALVAMQPLRWVVAEFFPLPAFAAAAFFIIVKLLLDQSFDVIPLLIGMAFGYLMKETKAPPQAAQALMGVRR